MVSFLFNLASPDMFTGGRGLNAESKVGKKIPGDEFNLGVLIEISTISHTLKLKAYSG